MNHAILASGALRKLPSVAWSAQEGRCHETTQGLCLRHLAHALITTNCVGCNSEDQSWRTGISVSGNAEDGTLPRADLGASDTLITGARHRGMQPVIEMQPGLLSPGSQTRFTRLDELRLLACSFLPGSRIFIVDLKKVHSNLQ